MAANPELLDIGLKVRRERPRIESFAKIAEERGTIVDRIHNFYTTDNENRSDEIEMRLQRYAKYRMWTEGKDWPWEGACFSLDSELLTAHGWKPVNEMSVSDRVYTRSPEGMAEYRPVAKVIKTKSSKAVSFKGKSIDLLVTPNHRLLIQDWSGKTKFVPAERFVGLPNQGWSIPLTSEWRGENPEKISGLPSLEYVRLLGWYIAEGSQNNGGTLALTQSRTANPGKCQIIERDLASAGITWNYNRNDFYLHSGTVPAPALAELRDVGVCDQKILPDHVLDLCPSLLTELLDAMMLGDGHVKANKHRIYYTTSKRLADQVQIIAQKTGHRARIIAKQPKPGGMIRGRLINGALPLYQVNINAKPTVQVRKLRIAVETFDEPIEFACVNVPPYNTLYVRRNGVATWCGNTDAAIPDMMTASMRTQDTLHNAVMSSRPAIRSKAMKSHDSEKEEVVDDLIDYQVFVEQPGEEIVGVLAHDFVNDGFYTAYVPWVEEKRNVIDVFVLGEIPPELLPMDFFRVYLEGRFPKAELIPSKEGWDWQIKVDGKKKGDRASFFTRPDGQVEVEIQMEAIRYNGPRIIPKDVQQVLHPVRCENLQIPGPSNPLGASHVILVDYPSVDEIKRLAGGDHPYYDLIDKEGLEKLGLTTKATPYQQREEQKDVMQGAVDLKQGPQKGAESHSQLTRLMCFDCYDVDGDGQDEDVIFWMILETKTLLRARYLTQMFPSNPPIRPLAEAHLFPVPGRRFSIGMLEMMEGLHDLTKQFFDQGGDAGTIANAPFGFYRATSNMRPEVIRMWPGEMYPLNDPKNDVHFPTMGNQNQAFTFNMVALLQQMEERLTTIGELQLGRVPHGKASALRTVQGMQTIMSQGDARPERVLRRFFIGLTQIWRIIHTLNRAFLPKNKQFLITGWKEKGKDPYATASPQDVQGDYMFDFSANALNTSKEALQMALQQMMGTYVSELNIMLGIMTPEGAYRLQRDWGKSLGPDPDKYLTAPSPGAMQPPIFVEDAIAMMFDGQMPQGSPAEGAQPHMQRLMEFMQSDEFGLMPPDFVMSIFKPYLERVAQMAMQERMQAQLLAAAQQFGQNAQQPGKSGPAAMPQAMGGQAPMQGAELMDETLPTAGGGANTGPA